MRIPSAGFLPRLSPGLRAAALLAALSVTAGREAFGRPVELSAEDRAVLETLRDAHRQFRTRPATGHVRATYIRKGPTLDEKRELEVYWKGDLLKQIVVSRSRHNEEQQVTLKRPESLRTIVRVVGPDCRVISSNTIDDPPRPLVVSRGALPHFDPRNDRMIDGAGPHDAWYRNGLIGGSRHIDETLGRLLRPGYGHHIAVTKIGNEWIDINVGSRSEGGLFARFDLDKGGRIVELHTWSHSENPFSLLTRFEWAPDKALEWRLAKHSYGHGTQYDTPDDQRDREVLTVHECETGIDLPDEMFDCGQIEIPAGTIIEEFTPDSQRPNRSIAGG